MDPLYIDRDTKEIDVEFFRGDVRLTLWDHEATSCAVRFILDQHNARLVHAWLGGWLDSLPAE